MPKAIHLPLKPGSRRTFLIATHRLGQKPEAEQDAELTVLMAVDMGDTIGRKGECLEGDLVRLGWSRADVAKLGEAALGHVLAQRNADTLRDLQREAA